jgi:nitronate monooxygenase
MESDEALALPFPLQGALTLPLGRSADGATVRRDFLPMWAGQGAAMVREMSARDLVQKLIVEAQALLD